MFGRKVPLSLIKQGLQSVIIDLKNTRNKKKTKINRGKTSKCTGSSLKALLFAAFLILPLIIEDMNILMEFNWIILYMHTLSISSSKNDIDNLQCHWGQFCKLRMLYY